MLMPSPEVNRDPEFPPPELPSTDAADNESTNIFHQVADAYFRPKSFESKEIYESLGVRTFKKYLPTTGDLMIKHVWSKFGMSSVMDEKANRFEKLRSYERSTRVYESVHVGAFSAFAGIGLPAGSYDNLKNAAITTTVQLGFNVYPIMLQRYNRLRTLRLLGRMSVKE